MSSKSVTAEDNDDRDSPSKKQKIHQKQSTDLSDTSANTSSDMMMANGTVMMTVGDQSEPEPREIQNQTSSNKAESEEAHPPEEINNNEPKDVEQDLNNLPLKLKMPEVFDFENLSCQERYDDIFDILADCKPFQVQQAFGLYLNNEGGDEQLELEGSQAIWRSMDLDCDVLVEVKAWNGIFFKTSAMFLSLLLSLPVFVVRIDDPLNSKGTPQTTTQKEKHSMETTKLITNPKPSSYFLRMQSKF